MLDVRIVAWTRAALCIETTQLQRSDVTGLPAWQTRLTLLQTLAGRQQHRHATDRQQMRHESQRGQGRKLSRQLSQLSIASESPESSTSSSRTSEQHSSVLCWADSDSDDCSSSAAQSHRHPSPASCVQLQPRRSSSSSSLEPDSPPPYPHPSQARGAQPTDPVLFPVRVHQQQQEAGTKLIALKQKRKGSKSQALKALDRRPGSKAQHAQHAQSKRHGANVLTGEQQQQQHRAGQLAVQHYEDFNEQPSTHKHCSASATCADQKPQPAQQRPSRRQGHLPDRHADGEGPQQHLVYESVSSAEKSEGNCMPRHCRRMQHDASPSTRQSLVPTARLQADHDRQQRLSPSHKHSSSAASRQKQTWHQHLQESVHAQTHQRDSPAAPDQASRSCSEGHSLQPGSSQAQQQQVEGRPGSGQGLHGVDLLTDSTAAAAMDVGQPPSVSVPAMTHLPPQQEAALATAVDIAPGQAGSPYIAAQSNAQPLASSLGIFQITSAEQHRNAVISPRLQGTGGACEAANALPGAMQALMIALENMTNTQQQKLASSQQPSPSSPAVAAAALCANDAASADSPVAGIPSSAGGWTEPTGVNS